MEQLFVTELKLLQLLIDFGIVVLILMVQCIVYPNFLYLGRTQLEVWHKKYTPRIGYIVGPLMLIQLSLALYNIFTEIKVFAIITLLLVLSTWISTAMQFVPLHKRITDTTYNNADLKKLVKRNWLRVGLWVLIFAWDLMTVLIQNAMYKNF